MSLKFSLIATAVWTVVMTIVVAGVIWWIFKFSPGGRMTTARAEQLGQGFGILVAIGYGAIWLPFAARLGKERRRKQQNNRRSR